MDTPPPETASLGSEIRRLRLTRGLSLAAAATAAGVSKGALAHWEADRRIPSGPILEALFGVLEAGSRERAAILATADPAYARVSLLEAPPLGPPASLGEILRAMRLRRGLTQEELARRLRVGQSSVGRWESGERDPSPEMQQGALRVLGATAEETVAVASLDPARRPGHDLEERYETIAKGPHLLAEALWIGMEGDLWWRAARSEAYDERHHVTVVHRADWYALSGRPSETAPLVRRAMRSSFGAPGDVPQGLAFGIVWSGLQLGEAPHRIVRRLDRWAARIRSPRSLAPIGALRAYALAQADEAAAFQEIDRAAAIAGDDACAASFVRLYRARILLEGDAPGAALRTLEEDDGIDALTLRAQAMLDLGRRPPSAWIEAIRARPASQQIHLYRQRLEKIERGLARLGEV